MADPKRRRDEPLRPVMYLSRIHAPPRQTVTLIAFQSTCTVLPKLKPLSLTLAAQFALPPRALYQVLAQSLRGSSRAEYIA